MGVDSADSPSLVQLRLAAARLYAITPDAAPDELETLVEAALRGGADIVQLRHKSMGRRELLATAQRLAALVHESDALFFVNDHVDVAVLSGADGVHLGPDDLSVASARRISPFGFLVGASAGTADAAAASVAAGAVYIGAGPVRATPVKASKAPIGIAGVKAVADAVPVPVFAIGGITLDIVSELVQAGVNRVCVVRDLAQAVDPEARAREYVEALR